MKYLHNGKVMGLMQYVPKFVITICARILGINIALILILGLSAYNTRSEAQEVTLEIKNRPIRVVLKEITKQTSYYFFYQEEVFSKIPNMTISLKREPINTVLQKVLTEQGLNYTVNKKNVTITGFKPTAHQQNQSEVKGTVRDTAGRPIQSVNIVQKGTNKATRTDADGTFTLQPSTGQQILIFSYTGYATQEIPITTAVMNVVLRAEQTDLGEVVVVGYGTQRKASLTGSVATVGGGDIRKSQTATLSNTLAGRAPGLIARQNSGQPGADQAALSIRGKSTFGENSMLVLVDGVVRNFDQINPAEIETVSILKDASSAAIYGARAANGVLLITTKRGAIGEPSISYNGYVGMQQPATRAPLLDAGQYMEMYNAGLASNGQNPLYSEEDIRTVRNNPDPLRRLANTDWWNETMQSWAPMSQHDLNLNGGSEKAKYFVALGYLDQGSLYKTSNFKRYNFRSNIDAKVGQHLSATLDLAGRYEDRKNPGAGIGTIFGAILRGRPTDPAYYPNGLPGVSNGRSPILEATQTGNNRDNWGVFQSSASLKYDAPFLPGLSIKGLAAFDLTYNTVKNFYSPYSYYNYNPENNNYESRSIDGTINLNQRSSKNLSVTTQVIANYTNKFDRHQVDATMLYETYSLSGSFFTAYREQYLSPLMPQELFAGAETAMRNDGNSNIDARAGWAGRFNYGFDNRYLLSATFRYDGSLRFPAGQRWGFFPGISAGWIISNESFMKDAISGLDFLKFKAGYGQLGNDRVNLFQYLSAYYVGINPTNTNIPRSVYIIDGVATPGIYTAGYPNTNITWERANTFDIGFESTWWNGKLSVEAGYFRKRTTDILLQRTAAVPGTFGAALPSENIGITMNQGLELDLGHRSTIGNVKVNARGTFTFARSKIIYMDEAANILSTIRQTGRPFDQYMGLQAMGLFQSQEEIDNSPRQTFGTVRPGDIRYADINGDGIVDDNDRTVIGRSNVPELVFGLSLGASWKGFDVDMLWQGAGNFNTYLTGEYAQPFFNGANPFQYMTDYWTPDNPNAAFPRPVAGGTGNNQRVSSFWLTDASYLRLRSMNIGYTLNPAMLSKLGLKHLRVFVSGGNLLTFSKMYGLDPEQPNESRGYYPQQRTVSLGLNLNL